MGIFLCRQADYRVATFLGGSRLEIIVIRLAGHDWLSPQDVRGCLVRPIAVVDDYCIKVVILNELGKVVSGFRNKLPI
jgi:hypothetical protein